MSRKRTERTFRDTGRTLCMAFGMAVLASACSRTTATDAAVARYEAALESLHPPAAEEHGWQDIAWPDVRSLRLETEEIRVGLLRFMDLDECGVGAMIAERNSALGLMAADSSTLLYEHELLARLTACRERLGRDGDDALRTLLDEALAVKRRNSDRVFWNATLGSREFGSLFSRATMPLSVADDHPARPAEQSLVLLIDLGRELGHPGLIVDEDRFWEAYRVLEQERYGGRLLTTVNLLAPALLAGGSAIERLDDLCRERPDEVSAAAGIWREELQPLLRRLTVDGGRWIAALDELVAMQRPVAPAAFADWYGSGLDPGETDSTWRQFVAAVAEHESAWARLEAGCT